MENVADESRKAVFTQPRSTALMAKSCPMEGSATFTDDPMNGPRNEERVATIRAARLVPRACGSLGNLRCSSTSRVVSGVMISTTARGNRRPDGHARIGRITNGIPLW